jgi:hypothetical protein
MIRPRHLPCAVFAAMIAIPPSAEAKSPLSRFGYYYADSEAYGHYMDKVVIPSDGTRLQDYTNLMLIDIGTTWGQTNPRRAVIDAANLGYQIVLYGATGFESNTPQTWQAGIDEYQSVVKGYERFVYALDLTDEPDGRGWSRAQIESLVMQAKNTYRGSMPVTVNLDNVIAQSPPRNMDLYMFDYYVNGGGTMTTKPQFDATFNGIMNGIRAAAPGKPVLMLGSSFNDNSIGFTRPTSEQTQWYYDAATNTPEVDGLMWFMLGNAPPTSLGAIAYPDLLNQHKLMGQQVLKPRTDLKVNDRVFYANAGAVSANYSGLAPQLMSGFEHGNNGGKCFMFGAGAENATRTVSSENHPGSVEAFLFDGTFSGAQQFGFRARNTAGRSITIYARGDTPNYLIDDEGGGRLAVDTGIPSVAHWQKVEFVFDGVGVRAYADSQLVYISPEGWTGGYSQMVLADPTGSAGVGYVDDLLAYQQTPAGTTVNFGANQSLGSISLTGGRLNIGRNSSGQTVRSDVQLQSLCISDGLASYLDTVESYNHATITSGFSIEANATLVKEGAGALTINGMQSHDVGALLCVNGGTTELNTDAGSVARANLSICAKGHVRFAVSQHLASVIVLEGGSISLASGDQFLQAREMSVSAGGAIDLADGRAVLDYDGAQGPAMARIRALLSAGYSNGAWTGEGGFVSSTAADSTRLGLGFVEASDLFSSPWPIAFGGAEADETSVLVRCTYYGDTNLSGNVDSTDFAAFLPGYGLVSGGTWRTGDFNFDGKVNTLDFNQLSCNFGESLIASPVAQGVVPEPQVAMLAVIFLMLCGAKDLRPGRIELLNGR